MKTLWIAIAALVSVSVAQAMTMKEEKQYKEWVTEINDPSKGYTETAKKNCGYTIPVNLDKGVVTPFLAANTSASAYCNELVSTISSMCEDATSKPIIKKNIKKVECKLSTKTEETTWTLKSGTLTFAFHTGSSNLSTKSKEWLENNLKN